MREQVGFSSHMQLFYDVEQLVVGQELFQRSSRGLVARRMALLIVEDERLHHGRHRPRQRITDLKKSLAGHSGDLPDFSTFSAIFTVVF